MSDPDRITLPFDEGLLELPEKGNILFIRPIDLPQLLSNNPRVTCEQGFKPFAEMLEHSCDNVVATSSGKFASVLVTLTRSRAENMAKFSRACDMVESGGSVIVSGQKTDGVESLLKSVKKICEVGGVLSKSHGKVFWVSVTNPAPELSKWQEDAMAKKNTAGFLTAPGMFSPDKIDPGSELLVQHIDGNTLKGRVADLGAGWGYLGAKVLELETKIEQLDLYEAEHSALEAAKANVTDPRAAFHWADVTKLGKMKEGYHAVISNPPFHQTRAAEPSIGIDFIKAAARILRPSGQLLMVANRQLPYENALDQNFRHWNILHQDKAFKIIRARKPIS